MRFVVLGDIRGRFKDASDRAHQAVEALGGRCDAIFACGDVEPNRDARDASFVPTASNHRRWVGEFPLVLTGSITFPAPLYFIGGEHEPWAALDALGPAPIAPGVEFLGRAGVKNVAGLNVAYLSGVRGDGTRLGLAERYARDERCCYVETELTVLRRMAARMAPVDVLITHDWPTGLRDEVGDPGIEALTREVRPKVHMCSHQAARFSGSLDGVRVEAFGPVEGGDCWAVFCRQPDGSITTPE